MSVLDSKDGSSSTKIMRRAENEKIDSAAYTWFLQKCCQQEPISGPILNKK